MSKTSGGKLPLPLVKIQTNNVIHIVTWVTTRENLLRNKETALGLKGHEQKQQNFPELLPQL